MASDVGRPRPKGCPKVPSSHAARLIGSAHVRLAGTRGCSPGTRRRASTRSDGSDDARCRTAPEHGARADRRWLRCRARIASAATPGGGRHRHRRRRATRQGCHRARSWRSSGRSATGPWPRSCGSVAQRVPIKEPKQERDALQHQRPTTGQATADPYSVEDHATR